MKKFLVAAQTPQDTVNAALDYINAELNPSRLKSKDKNHAALMAEDRSNYKP